MFKRTKNTPYLGWGEIRDISQQFLDLPKCDCYDRNYCKEKLEKIIDRLQIYGLLLQGCSPIVHGFHIFQQIYSNELFSHVPERCGICFIYTICTAIMIAEKFNTDIPYNNKYWAQSLGINLDYLNEMETLIMASKIRIHIDYKELFKEKLKLTINHLYQLDD